MPSASSKAASGPPAASPSRDGLREIALHQLQEAVRLAAIEPDDGGDVLLLLRAEVVDLRANLAVDVARVEHQHLVARAPRRCSLARSKNQSSQGTVRV